MAQTKDILQSIRKLSDLDIARRRLLPADAPALAELAVRIGALRKHVPPALLIHYDLRGSRGKAAVAPVRRGICGACHLSLPSGLAAELRRGGKAVYMCSNCGVFIYLGEEDPPNAPAPVVAAKRPRAPRKQAATAS